MYREKGKKGRKGGREALIGCILHIPQPGTDFPGA